MWRTLCEAFLAPRAFGEFWAFFWDLGPPWGSLWRPLGDFWGGFGVPLDGFGLPLGSFLDPLGRFWGSWGSFWAPFGLHLGPLWHQKCEKGDIGESLVFHQENHMFRGSGRPGGCQNGTQRKPHGRKYCKGEAKKGIRRARKTKNVAMMCQCEAKRADLGRLREPKPHAPRQDVPRMCPECAQNVPRMVPRRGPTETPRNLLEA